MSIPFAGDTEINTSGNGHDAIVPPQLQRWNLGAALFGFLWWSINVGFSKPAWHDLSQSEYFGRGYGTSFMIFGKRGNELSWKYRRWPSALVFLRVQQAWVVAAGLVVFGLPIGLVALFILGIVQKLITHG